MNYLTSNQIQEKYNISRTTLFRLEKKGLPFIEVGRSKRYEESIVEQWLKNIKDGIEDFLIGQIYDNTTIASKFACGTQGGMRRSHTSNTLVIFSDHTRGMYDDIWVDESRLLYTGMGQEGNQVLTGNQNITLYESKQNGVNVHLFETFNPGEHIYRGQVELYDDPYEEYQLDATRTKRTVWIFPLILKTISSIPSELIEAVKNSKEKQAKKMSLEELENRAKNPKKITRRSTINKIYVRDVFVSEYVKMRANGFCDLCGNEAPFLDKDGKPYLESHHVEWLSKGGEDTITNCCALCPSCHRKIHILNSSEDKAILKMKLDQYNLKK